MLKMFYMKRKRNSVVFLAENSNSFSNNIIRLMKVVFKGRELNKSCC